jgi:glycosyltransferase involved in cell wall biosynthesis
MRVLHISALPVWSMEGKGGMPSLLKTLQGHIQAGFKLHLILPKYDLLSTDFAPLQISYDQGYDVSIAECHWLPAIKKMRALSCRLGGCNEPPYLARWILNMLTLLLLTFSFFSQALKVRYKKDFRSDLIYAHNQYAALTGFLLRVLWRVPNVSRLYGTFLADLMGTPLVSLRYPTAAAGYLIPASLLICANDGTRGDEVAKKFHIPSHRFRFWQNGIDPPKFIPKASREEFVSRYGPSLRLESKWAVSCSRLSYWKRIDRMIRALAICRNKGVDCQLLIAGEGPEKDALVSLSRCIGIADALVWLGAVAHDDIWALLHVADVFMITNDVTNRCNPLYEAAWAGLPVISINDQSTKDLLKHRDNSLLSDKDDAEGLGLSLIEVCENHQLANLLSENQRKLSESFWTWEQRMQVETSDLKRLIYSCR